MPPLFSLFGLVSVYEYYFDDVNFMKTIEQDGLAALFQVANWHAIDSSSNY
ncbi:MAG: hypothetical protein LBP35_04545 [Candidatus Ancillula trichonymphae]|jgi:hypothetical protein|nr:hypothetical protein [Candidatus Ancillula trichonymphae]